MSDEKSPKKQKLDHDAPVDYDGLVLTTIDVEVGDDKKTCRFTDKTDNAEVAKFIKNIKEENKNNFTAEVVDFEEAKRMIEERMEKEESATPLFCVHGFSVQPAGQLKAVMEAKKIFEDNKGGHYPIPVIWAADGNTLRPLSSYLNEKKEQSVEAGAALRSMVDAIKIHFPHKSIMTHSMGNRVLIQANLFNELDVKFDNIFMVAADVPYDLYYEEPEVGTQEEKEEKKKQAENVYHMLVKKEDGTPKGKVHVLYNHSDKALLFSDLKIVNGIERLGKWGNAYKKKGHIFGENEYIYDEKLVSKRWIGLIENHKMGPFPGLVNHSYQFSEDAIKIYCDVAKEFAKL